MSKNETALDRLERTKLPSTEREYTIEEQMDSASTDDFLDGMSDVAKNNLGRLFEEVTTDDAEETSVEEQSIIDNQEPVLSNSPSTTTETQDELFNNNMKPKRQYRKKSDNSETVSQTQSNPMTNTSNPVLDQLAKDVIDDLRNRCHKINRFDDKSMEMIFNYMYNKF